MFDWSDVSTVSTQSDYDSDGDLDIFMTSWTHHTPLPLLSPPLQPLPLLPPPSATAVATATFANTAAEAARCAAPRSCPTWPLAPPRPLLWWAGAGDGEGGGCPRLWRRCQPC